MAGNNIHSQITDQAEIHVPKGFTEAANHTGLVKNASGLLEWRDLDSLGENSNFEATVDPIAANDSSQGYAVGSRWVNTVQRNMFECVDASVGSAVWVPIIRANANGTIPPTVTDDASKGYKEGSVWIVRQSGLNQVWICADSTVGSAEWEELVTGTVVGIDHRTLSHLDSDDHLQYLNRSGVRPMTGHLDMGSQDIINVVNVFGEQRLLTTNTVRVKKNPGFGEFSSVAAAITSVTTASVSNPFLIQVGPGVYTEPQIVMKPYVYVEGSGYDSTIIQPSSPGSHLVLACDNSAISNLLLTGVTGSGQALIYYSTATGTAQTTFWAQNIRFGQSDTLVISDGTAGIANFFIDSARYGGVYQFNTGFVSRTSGATLGRIVLRNSTSTKMTSPYPLDMFVCDGTGCEIALKSVVTRTGVAAGGTNGLRLRNGGTARIASLDIDGFQKGLWAENVGSGPTLIGGIITFLNNTIDIQVDNASTSGGISCGADDASKVVVNPTAVNFGYVILGISNGDLLTSGNVRNTQPDGTFTDISTLIKTGATMGIFSNGDIDVPVSGFTVTVEAGFGYLQKSDGSLIKVTWPSTPITLAANSKLFVYFDSTGTLQSNVVMPDITQNIVLGRIITHATGIETVEESGILALHGGNVIGQALRSGLGAIYSTGSIVSEFGTRQMAVSAGSYFYGERNFKTQGGNPVTFVAFYQNGSGGFTRVPSQTTVDNAFWDNGTGTLAALGAGNYAKHSIYLLGDSTGDFDSEVYFLVYSQAQYTALTLAEQGNLPNPPDFMTGAITLVASVIVQQGQTHFSEVRDERPIVGSGRTANVAATSFHDNLLQRGNDGAHLQYLLISGTRAMTGDLNMGTHNIASAGTYNGVTVENHHARHQPGNGLDELPTAAGVQLTPNLSNAIGTSTSIARADHVHNVPTGVPSALTPNAGNSQGSLSAFAQQDHIHNVPTAAPANQTIAATTSDGSASTFSRSDHLHTFSTAIPVTQNADQANAMGTSTSFVRADHVHNIPTAIATDVGSTNAQGTTSTFSKSDHVHKGVHSIKAGLGGTQRFGDLSIDAGNGTTVTDDGSGNFTVDTQFGANEFVITSTSGLVINYTGGRFVNGQNGSINNITSGAITVPANLNPGYLFVAINPLTATGAVTASATMPGIDSIPIAQFVSSPSTITSTTDIRAFLNIVPLANALRVTYSGSGLIVNYNSGAVRINGTQTAITANTLTLSNTIALGAIYVDPSTNTVTANATGTFPSNCVPMATYTTSGGNVTALSNARSFINGQIQFGSSGDIAQLTPDLSAAAGSTNRYADAGHIHNVPTATPTDVGSANAPGSASTFVKSDHVHKGVHSVHANAGSNRFGDLSLQASGRVSVTDDGSGNFTLDTIGSGSNEFVTTIGAGLTVNYTGGNVIINGSFVAIAGGTITVPANANNSFIYVNTSRVVAQGNLQNNGIPLAQFSSNASIVTALSDRRCFLDGNVVFGAAGDIASLTPNLAAAAGATNKYADAGHVHNVPTAAPVAQTPNNANADGSAATFSRADHVHNVPTAAPANQTIAAAASDGSAATFSRSDHLHTFSTAAPVAQTPDNANAQGSSTSFARADHVHNVPTAAAVSISTSTTNTQGSTTNFARADHTHAVSVTNTEASSSTQATTTSTTDVLITGMTSTPASGTYLVVFSGSFTNSVAADSIFVNIYVGGTIQSDTERQMVHPVSFGNANGTFNAIATNKIVTVNGSQAIEVRWRVSAGTGTVNGRTMSIIKLS